MKKTMIFTLLFLLLFSSMSLANSEFPYMVEDNYGNIWYTKTRPYISADKKSLTTGTTNIYERYNTDGTLSIRTNEKDYLYRFTHREYKPSDIKNSNFDILYSDGTVFFYQPGLTIPEVIHKETQKIIPDLVGQTLMILPVGFGIVSATLLITLLVGYFRRYRHRSI